MVSSMPLAVSLASLACIVHLSLGYVPVNERPILHDRLRPNSRVDPPTSSSSSRVPSRGLTPVKHTPVASSRGAPFLIPSILSGVHRRLTSVETSTSDLSTKYGRLNTRMSSLTGQIHNLQSQMRSMSPVASLRSANQNLETRVSTLEAENVELREFLVQFEHFVNRLMSAEPASYDPSAAPAQRLSRLHQYLGNAEAELISFGRRTVVSEPTFGDDDPSLDGADDGPAVVSRPHTDAGIMGVASTPDRTPVKDVNNARKGTSSRVSSSGSSTATASRTAERTEGVRLTNDEADRLAAALEQLNIQNRDLTTRLQAVEQQAADSNPVGVQSVGTASVSSSNAITDELLEKVDLLEQVVALQASSILDDNTFTASDAGTPTLSRGAAGGGRAATKGLPTGLSGEAETGTASRMSRPAMKQDDVDTMRTVLQDARSGSSSRKSAFSVARTSPLLGSRSPQKIEFDHVFVNKGRDFVVENSTFVCERPGYYFITFHLRSYDGYYLGVTLMKNSEVVTAVYTDADTRNVMEGQSVIVHMERGDSLCLRLAPSERFGLHSDSNNKYVTFSGFLVYGGF